MDFRFSDSQKMLKETVKEFILKKIRPCINEIEESNEIPGNLFQEMGELNLLGILAPGQWGGMERELIDFVLIAESLAEACPALAWSYVSSMCVTTVIQYIGTESQKNEYLSNLINGKSIGAFGFNEAGSGTNWQKTLTTRSVEQNNQYLVTGSKSLISNSSIADVFIIIARNTGPNEGFSAFIVKGGTPGFTRGKSEKKMGLSGDPIGELFLDNCLLPAENLLGTAGDIKRVIALFSKTSMLGQAAVSCGIANSAICEAKKYITERDIGDKQTLANLESIQALYAENFIKSDAIRYTVYSAACNAGTPGPTPAIIMSLVYGTKIMLEIADAALNMYGGHGCIRDYPIERIYRDAKTVSLLKPQEHLKKMAGSSLLATNQ